MWTCSNFQLCILTICRNHWGWEIDALNSISHALNFTYTIENAYPLKWGYADDGSFRGPVGDTMRNTVDFNIGSTPIEYGNSRVIFLIPSYNLQKKEVSMSTWNEKQNKNTWVFFLHKYNKFWSKKLNANLFLLKCGWVYIYI